MITLSYKNVDPVKDEVEITVWLERCLVDLNISNYQIDYVFVDDQTLLSMNQKHLKHDSLTDILTFDLSDEKNNLNSEIYISHDRVLENSIQYGCTFEEELRRVMIHGVLHLSGYNDHTEDEKSLMRRLENKYIKH
jgi:probable rRNA maturation factor